MIGSMITELIAGYVLPGRPIALMLFKGWGYVTLYHGRCCEDDSDASDIV